MAEIRASFFVECEELLEGLHDALNVLADSPGNTEAVTILFRAVHSIKGGAGAFGLDALVACAHRVETALDQFRSGRVEVTPRAVKLLYRTADLLQDHVRAARDGDTAADGADAVLRELEALSGCDAAVEEPAPEFTPTALDLAFGDDEDATTLPDAGDTPGSGDASPSGPRHWSVRFTPSAALYASGNEALLVLRALCSLGAASVTCDIPDDLSIADAAAEEPRLAWHIDLDAEVERAEIEGVFDFVADICAVEIAESTERPQPVAASPAAEDMEADHAQIAAPAPLRLVRDNEAGSRSEGASAPVPEAGITVRVELERIDRLVNLVGELVINQAMLAQSVSQSGTGNPEIAAGLDAFLSLTRDLQDSVMAVRAQPVKPLFQRMARIVREASAAVGKEVRLRTEGDATEVDKTVIERLADPLTHMVRNAVSHGLETPERRLFAGKPREGQVTLSAAHRAGRILIEVADDGAGIDRQAVLGRARARGLVPPDAVLGDAEIDNLLFVPGFTTADKVSSLSGRGVGMDVVKSAIAALGGRVSIASKPGRGTTFSISLPLTLAVLDGMVIRAAGQSFVVPLSAIVETAALTPEVIRRVGGRAELLHIRGELVPLIDLGAQLGFRAAAEMNRTGIVLLTAQENGARTALIVDAVMEQRQVVIKGLGPGFGRMPGVAAATILGDGRIALILDPADLVQTTRPPDIALAG